MALVLALRVLVFGLGLDLEGRGLGLGLEGRCLGLGLGLGLAILSLTTSLGLCTCQHQECKAWLYGVNDLMPCCGLFINKLSCLAVRGRFGFFNPRNRRSYSTVFIASLLLIAGVEPNPRPSACHRGDVIFGSINICSAVRRAALVNSMIDEYKLDMVALQKTWIEADDAAVVRNGV